MGLGIALSSVLLVLCLPLGEQAYLGPICIVPLLVATRNRGFVWGFGAAIICLFLAGWLALQGWFYGSRVAGESGSAMVYAACGIFGFSVALTTAFAADSKLGEKPVWALAGLGVLFEAALLIELPGHLALTQYRNPGMMAIASVGGVWLVSFLLWWMNLAISRLVLKRDWWLAMVLIAVVYIGQFLPATRSAGGLTVAAIQINPMFDERLASKHREAASKGVELAVWPEFAGIAFVGRDTKKLQDLSLATALVTSFPDDTRPKPFNVAALFHSGKESERYAKRKLFGGEKHDHQAGNKSVVVDFDKYKLGMGICFDSCFPKAMRETARTADMIALPTIDPESPYGFLAAMHAAYTPFRAAETGVPIIRADGMAYSMIIDSSGTILAEAGQGDALLIAKMPPRFRYPLAIYVGDGMLLVSAFLVVFGFWRRPPVESTGRREVLS